MRLFRRKQQHHAQDVFDTNLYTVIEEHNIDLILDVGANVGQYAQGLFSQGFKGHIISFEPGKIAHETLSAKAVNHPRWTIAPRMALGRKREMLTLHTFDRTDMNSLLPPNENAFKSFPRMTVEGTEEVQVERLDAILQDIIPKDLPAKHILLKTDTQGSELAVFEGASGCLNQITLLQLEVPVVPVYSNAPVWMDVLLPVHQSGFQPILTSSGFNKRLKGTIDMDVVFKKSKD